MKNFTTNVEEIRGLGYINVTKDNNIIAKIPYSLPGYELPGDMNKDEAVILSNLILRMTIAVEQTYKYGDKIKVITMPNLGILTVEIVCVNGIIAQNERFYSYENIEKA